MIGGAVQQPVRTWWLTAIAAPLALLFGCPATPGYPECKNDTICAVHEQVCVAGFCRGCRDDSQCKANEQCLSSGCVKQFACGPASPCAAGLFCRAGACGAECSPGTQVADCGADRHCEAGACVATAQCIGDGECGMGKACVEGKCLAQGNLQQIYSGGPLDCAAGPIFFNYDDSTLDQRARDSIDAAWTCLQRGGFRHLKVIGNTDERGTTEYNLALGSKRAEAVGKYLIGLGADARKLRSVSFGKERPIADGQDEAAFAKNRRVELDPEK
jgi:hypothetical protein